MMNKRYCLREWGMIHLKTIVCPASKFHLAVLVVKREPRDVNKAGGLKNQMRSKKAISQFFSTLNIPGGM